MAVSVDDIKKRVRIALDRNNVSTQLLDNGDIDTLTVEQIIESKIEQAAKEVILAAPHHLLGVGEDFATGLSVSWSSQAGYGSGSVNLPAEFLRLHSFQMSDWVRPVYDAITVDDPLYSAQKSRFGGVRGNPQKPVCAIVNGSTNLVLEFYSCTGGQGVNISTARYFKVPKISNGQIDIPNRLLDATVYRIAYMVALTLLDAERATVLDNLFKSSLA